VDNIYIKDLEIFAYHGVFDNEKLNGQFFLISVKFYLSLQKAGISDNLDDTFNYAELIQELENKFTEKKYNLLEACAEELAKHFLCKYSKCQKIKISIRKKNVPITQKVKELGISITRSKHLVYLGLGSNLGNKEDNLKRAIKALESLAEVEKISSFYITEPVGYKEQDNFLNAAVKIKTLLNPYDLLEQIMRIEKSLKRERTIKWGPRTIDIDILFYDNLVMNEDFLTIPHKESHKRLFVLDPLSEIGGNLIHPTLGLSILELRKKLKNEE